MTVEGMNPFWFGVILIATFAGPAFLLLTLVAGIVWRVGRARAARTVFLVLLACTAFAGLSWLAGALLIGTHWP